MAEFRLGRLKFVWRNAWATSTTYVKDDIVKYGGKTYVCIFGHTSNATAAGGFYTDLTANYWNQMSDGIAWANEWATSTYYKINDTARYGGKVYICLEGHTSNASASGGFYTDLTASKWELLTDGQAWESAWDTATYYKVNDIVNYGGRTYICNQGHTSQTLLEDDQGKWDLYVDGLAFVGTWSGSSVHYKVNDIVSYGGQLYICNTHHTTTSTFDVAKFTVFANGLQFEGIYDNATSYQPGDVVTYGSNSYIALVTTVGVLPTDPTNWNPINQGLVFRSAWDNGTQYYRGDIVTYGAYSYVALRDTIGDNPDVSVSDWSVLNPGQEWQGVWSSGTAYTEGDIVSYGAYTYVALRDTTGDVPDVSASDWQQLNGGQEFRGVWVNGTEYFKGDIITYSGYSYICVQTHQGDESSDVTPNASDFWNVLNPGQRFRGVYSVGTQYYTGDVIRYGAYTYIALQDTIGENPSTVVAKWEQLNPGQDFRSTWNSGTDYTKGDVVRYGAYTYIALRDTTNDNPDVSASDWEQLNPGQEWQGVYDNGTAYTEGDIVSYGAYTYIALQDTTGNLPTNATYWNQLNAGQEWQSDWDNGTQYYKGDIVRYGAYTYIALRDTVGDNPDVSASDWTVLTPGLSWQGAWAIGTDYTEGDVVQYGAYTYVALRDTTGDNPLTETSDWAQVNSGQEWQATYSGSTDYTKGDIVQYGGYTYIATTNTTGNLPSNISYWNILNKGYTFIGVYNGGTAYKPGELVTYGGNLYAAKLDGTGNLPSNATYWDLFAKGTEYKSEYNSGTTYKVGDIVKYGARLYLATAEGSGNLPTNASYFTLYTEGVRWAGEYADATEYKIGDITRYGGRSYVCILGHTSDTDADVEPPNATYWELLVSGFNWLGNWDINTEYELGDVVLYLASSFICVASDNTGVTPGTDGSKWNALTQGDPNVVMTTRGDIIRQGSGGAERLPLGPNTSYIYSDGTDVKWGFAAPTKVFYVHDNGNDTTGDGTTLATAWRTIAKACTETYNEGQCTIHLSAGIYEEQCPMKVGRNVCIEGDALGAVTVKPASGLSLDGSTPNANSQVFQVNNGTRVRNIVFRDFSTDSVMIALDPGTDPNDDSVWIISQSPYIQNCTSFSTGGTGMLVDGSLHAGGFKSMVANDWTQINSGGIGVHVTNDARVELVSVFTYYCDVGYLAESGGKIRSLNGSCAYGEFGARATGFSSAESALTGTLRLIDTTISSVQELNSNVTIARSVQDSDRSIFAVGFTSPQYPYPPQPTTVADGSTPLSRAYLAKFSSSGTLEFQATLQEFGGWAAAVCVTGLDGNSYIGVNSNDGVTARASVVKFNANGEVLWQKQISESSTIHAIVNDRTYIYVLYNHEVFGAGVLRMNQAGAVQYSARIDTSDSSVNTLTGIDMAFTSASVNSEVTYENEGDINAENNLYILCNDSVSGENLLVRTTNTLARVDTKSLGAGYTIFKMDIDLGSEDGIYFVMVGKTNAGSDAYMARFDILGNIEWQKSIQITSPDGSTLENSQYYNVFPFGDEIFAQGAVLFDPESENYNYERGLIVKFSSDGTLLLAKSISDELGMSFRGIHVDGVNLILTGIKNDLDSVVINVDRDVTDLGTATGYTIATETAAANTETLAARADSDLAVNNISGNVSDQNFIATLATGITRNVVGTRQGFGSIGRGIQWTIADLARRPKTGSVMQIAGDTQTYFVIDVISFDETDSTGTAVINVDPGVPNSKAPDDNTVITFREAYSQVRMTGHDFLDIGSGDFSTTAYPVLLKDDYAQRPNQAREIDESNGGRCFYTSTDQDGNFRVGAYFRVDQATGRATLSSEDFDLTGLNELQLGSVRAGRRGATINEFSTDGTMSDVSDGAVPTERAVVTYVQAQLSAAIAQQTAFTVGLGW
jgi:hypothetical protein